MALRSRQNICVTVDGKVVVSAVDSTIVSSWGAQASPTRPEQPSLASRVRAAAAWLLEPHSRTLERPTSCNENLPYTHATTALGNRTESKVTNTGVATRKALATISIIPYTYVPYTYALSYAMAHVHHVHAAMPKKAPKGAKPKAIPGRSSVPSFALDSVLQTLYISTVQPNQYMYLVWILVPSDRQQL